MRRRSVTASPATRSATSAHGHRDGALATRRRPRPHAECRAVVARASHRHQESNREARIEVARLQTSAQLFIASGDAKTRAVEREEKQRTRAAGPRSAARCRGACGGARSRVDRRARAGRDIGIGLRRGLNVGGDRAQRGARGVLADPRRTATTRRANRGLNGALSGGRLAPRRRPRGTAAGWNVCHGPPSRHEHGMSRAASAGGHTVPRLVGRSRRRRKQRRWSVRFNCAFANATGTDAGNRVAGMPTRHQGVTGADQMNTIRAIPFSSLQDRGPSSCQIIQQGLPGALRLCRRTSRAV